MSVSNTRKLKKMVIFHEKKSSKCKRRIDSIVSQMGFHDQMAKNLKIELKKKAGTV